jgi:hypothetical protein
MHSPPSQETNCRPQASGFLPHSKRDIARDLGHAPRARVSSFSTQERCVLAKKAEFPFHSMARPTLGRRRFQVARLLRSPRPVAPVAAITPAALAVVNLSRTVATDQKLRLDFLHSINPDCTASGFATVRVLEQPKHGTIALFLDQSNWPHDCQVSRIFPALPGFKGPPRAGFSRFWG